MKYLDCWSLTAVIYFLLPCCNVANAVPCHGGNIKPGRHFMSCDKGRCFFFCDDLYVTWDIALAACKRYGGRLAVDNLDEVHASLAGLLRSSEASQGAWLGARTRPLYWYWKYDKSGCPLEVPLAYQGCYMVNTKAFKASDDTTFRGCMNRCKENGYPFFSIKEGNKTSEEFGCTCMHHISDMVDSHTCTTCTSNGESLLCGNERADAVYSVHWTGTPYDFNYEYTDQLEDNKQRCLQARKFKGKAMHQFPVLKIQNSNCTSSAEAVCVSNQLGWYRPKYCPIKWMKYSEFCYRKISRRSWNDAVHKCSSQNNGWLLSLTESHTLPKRYIPERMWVSGTTKMGWLWIHHHGSYSLMTEERHWQHLHEPSDAHCLLLTKPSSYSSRSAGWKSLPCSDMHPFICETEDSGNETSTTGRPTGSTRRSTRGEQPSLSSRCPDCSSLDSPRPSTSTATTHSPNTTHTSVSTNGPVAKGARGDQTRLYVGIGTGMVLLLLTAAASALLFLVWKGRQKPKSIAHSHDAPPPYDYGHSGGIQHVMNPSYETSDYCFGTVPSAPNERPPSYEESQQATMTSGYNNETYAEDSREEHYENLNQQTNAPGDEGLMQWGTDNSNILVENEIYESSGEGHVQYSGHVDNGDQHLA